jgi:hypothetical protein
MGEGRRFEARGTPAGSRPRTAFRIGEHDGRCETTPVSVKGSTESLQEDPRSSASVAGRNREVAPTQSVRAREITSGFALESGGARTDWWHPSHRLVATRALAADRAGSNTSLPWLRALAPGAPTSGSLGAEMLSISRSTVASPALNAGSRRCDSWLPSL